MTRVDASLDMDANHKVIGSGLPFLARKSRTYTGAAGLGAQGATTLFTVTGDVLVEIIATCSVDLVGVNATASVGVAGAVSNILATTTATGIDAGMGWDDNTPSLAEAHTISQNIIGAGLDIIETIATADITAGALTYYCFWRPLSVDGNLVAA